MDIRIELRSAGSAYEELYRIPLKPSYTCWLPETLRQEVFDSCMEHPSFCILVYGSYHTPRYVGLIVDDNIVGTWPDQARMATEGLCEFLAEKYASRATKEAS